MIVRTTVLMLKFHAATALDRLSGSKPTGMRPPVNPGICHNRYYQWQNIKQSLKPYRAILNQTAIVNTNGKKENKRSPAINRATRLRSRTLAHRRRPARLGRHVCSVRRVHPRMTNRPLRTSISITAMYRFQRHMKRQSAGVYVL